MAPETLTDFASRELAAEDSLVAGCEEETGIIGIDGIAGGVSRSDALPEGLVTGIPGMPTSSAELEGVIGFGSVPHASSTELEGLVTGIVGRPTALDRSAGLAADTEHAHAPGLDEALEARERVARA